MRAEQHEPWDTMKLQNKVHQYIVTQAQDAQAVKPSKNLAFQLTHSPSTSVKSYASKKV